MIYIIQDISGGECGGIISVWSTRELAEAEVKRITSEYGAENGNMWIIIPRTLDVPKNLVDLNDYTVTTR